MKEIKFKDLLNGESDYMYSRFGYILYELLNNKKGYVIINHKYLQTNDERYWQQVRFLSDYMIKNKIFEFKLVY